MSLAAILHQATSRVRALGLPSEAEADLLTVLHANQSETVRFFLAAGLEAGVAPAPALERTAALFFNYAAVQLADDIADGDCHYLANPAGAGTAAQYMLQNLFYLALAEAEMPMSLLVVTAQGMLAGAGPQSFEVRTRHWDYELARRAAEGFGGAYSAAYLRVLWEGSRWQEHAGSVGFGLGIGTYLAGDIRSRDPRFATLVDADAVQLLHWALRELEAAEAVSLPSIRGAAAPARQTLLAALGALSDRPH